MMTIENRLGSICDGMLHISSSWCDFNRALTIVLQPQPIPCFNPNLISELRKAQFRLNDLQHRVHDGFSLIIESDLYHFFSLGGDLRFFIDILKPYDNTRRPFLETYAYTCTDIVYDLYNAPFERVKYKSLANVFGECRGGGVEIVLACDQIAARDNSAFSFPEYLFGSFPGMGAIPMLRAIDLTPEDINRSGIECILPRVKPKIDKGEFLESTGLWVENVLSMSDENFRKLQRIRKAQVRKFIK